MGMSAGLGAKAELVSVVGAVLTALHPLTCRAVPVPRTAEGNAPPNSITFNATFFFFLLFSFFYLCSERTVHMSLSSPILTL